MEEVATRGMDVVAVAVAISLYAFRVLIFPVVPCFLVVGVLPTLLLNHHCCLLLRLSTLI